MLGLCLLSIVGAVELAGAETPESMSLPDNPLEGRLLFESKQCHQCHGITGSGNGPMLAEGQFSGSFLDLGAALWNHVPGMSLQHELHGVTWPQLDRQEVVRLLAFLYYIGYLGRPGDPARGQLLFQRDGCSACHEIGVDATTHEGPDLSELRRFASPLYIAGAIWNHGPSMLETIAAADMAAPRFEEGDLADLSAYIRQEGRASHQQRMLLSPGNPNRGADVFQNKGCATCHSTNDRGLGGVDLQRSAEGIAGTMWNHALEMSRSMDERGVPWPNFTTAELADLIAYMYFLPFADDRGNARRGADIFVQRACADCHLDAASSHPGPDLSGAATTGSAAGLVAAMWNHAPVMKEVFLEEGRPWPHLTGEELRDLLAYLKKTQSP